jgi:hypothetical protein
MYIYLIYRVLFLSYFLTLVHISDVKRWGRMEKRKERREGEGNQRG